MIKKKYTEFINEEVGMKNLSKITKQYKKFEIWFHKDLDGVTSALAMRYFLENYYNLKMVDCHIIQYGGLEYAVKTGQEDTLKILVDFAHSKPMFTIATDHHDSQVGDKETDSTYFKSTRSNVETISGEISYSDVFTPQDIKLIQTVDSANFLVNNITPDDVQNSIFKYTKSDSAEKNRFMMGLVVNRLLLAYKNKRLTVKSLNGKNNHINKNILECLVMDSTPSLYSMFNNIRHYINNAKTNDKAGKLASPEEIANNLSNYISRMKDYKFVEDPETGSVSEFDPSNRKHQYLTNSGSKITKGVSFDEEYKIIAQYGGGSMIKPGSYDRYTAFKNNPDAEFWCIAWAMGLLQVSCNPFKEKSIDVNLGEIAKEVMAKHESILKRTYISLDMIKKEFEESQDWKSMQKQEGDDYQGVGFKHTDLEAFYDDCIYTKKYDKIVNVNVKDEKMVDAMNTLYPDMSPEQKKYLSYNKIPAWELITRNSGGHKCITNITGFNFLKYNKKVLEIAYKTDKYTDLLKMIAKDFINVLKSKIDELVSGKEVTYDTKGIQFTGQDTNE
jgi:hypothetical protein